MNYFTTEPHAVPDDFEFKAAASPEERTAAFRLVHDSYVRAGLIDPNPIRLRVTSYHLNPGTTVFVALRHGEVICTITLIPDSDGFGVPIEDTFPDEIDRLRNDGLKFGEVSCLADRRARIERILPVFAKLTRVMAQFAMKQGLGGLVIAVHPRHVRFYRRLMGFQVVGPEKCYAHVKDRPAVPCLLDFEEARIRIPECYRRYFGKPVEPEQLLSSPLTPEERSLYERAATLSQSEAVLAPYSD